MKRLIVFLLVFLAVLPACGAQQETITSMKETTAEAITADHSAQEELLLALLEAETQEPLQRFFCGDFDCNGRFEAFAFTGEGEPPEGLFGTCWFINEDGVKLLERYKVGYSDYPSIYTFGENGFFVINQYATTGGRSVIWGVRDGVPCEELLPSACGFQQIDARNFTLQDSTYDSCSTQGVMAGHTWKKYWFFWDGKAFREYGGLRLTEKQLRKFSGAAEILKQIKRSGYVLGDIFYRGNQIVNINYSREIEPENINYNYTTLHLDLEAKTLRVEEEASGIYQAALAPEIAATPELPEIFN